MIAYADTNNGFVFEKLISVGFALSIVLLCHPQTVIYSYIVAGNAHNAMAVLYFMKAGKVTPAKTAMFLLLVAVLFYIGFNAYNYITMLTGIWLIFHVYVGEMKFIKRPYTLPYFLLTICIAIITNVWLASRLWQFEPNMLLFWPPVLIISIVAIGLFFFQQKKPEIEMFFVFLVGLLTLMLGLEVTGYRPFPAQILGFIALAHYMTFYVRHTHRFSKEKRKLTTFLLEVILANIVFIIGFFAVYYMFDRQTVLYDYAYSQTAFYVWSIAHFAATFKISDYRHAFKLKAPSSENGTAYA